MSEPTGVKQRTGAQTGAEDGEQGAAAPPFRYTAALAGAIEDKWQRRWRDDRVFHAPNPVGDLAEGFARFAGKPKLYVLDMFPYPSGVGLHVGHPLGYIATDIFARYMRMAGRNVLHTIGYDAFGLPAEQFAVQTGQHPRVTTERNIATMRTQLRRLGLAHDERRSVATTDVAFYRWTQWIFLQIFNAWYDEEQDRARPIAELIEAFEKGQRPCAHPQHNPDGKPWNELDELTRRKIVDAHRLAYLDEQPVNWCPALGTVLANEEVTAEGRSERGDHPVYKRPMKQWMLRITAYAERLLRDLEQLDWPEPVKLMQRNWIGRSEGARIRFPVEGIDEAIEVFTTRPDTVFGATFMVLAPEHPLVDRMTPLAWPEGTPALWTGGADSPRKAIERYRQRVEAMSDVQRQAAEREKTGVFTGAFAVNPASGERMPIFIADYVLMGYGSGAIMAVPAHDERDFEFAERFDLPIVDVVYPRTVHAIRWFVERAGEVGTFDQGWEAALADFLGLIVNSNLDPDKYDEALRIVRSRRAAPGQAPGAERRGAVRQVWLETIGALASKGLAGLREEFMRKEHWLSQGQAFTEPGVAVNSPPIEGLPTEEAKRRIVQWLEEQGVGERAVTYKLRDWLFSRQRYWGEPFPIVYDEHDLPVALPESTLPVELPEMERFEPDPVEGPDAAVPQPPLARAKDWATVELDLGDGPKTYRRELNTMPQWAGSCWYYLRYIDPNNDRAFCDPVNERYWMGGAQPGEKRLSPPGRVGGVDLYVGGVEHAVLHLLYARFWHKVLYDLGYVSTPEPFQKLFNQGYIQAWAYRDRRGVYVPAEEVVEEPPGSGKFFHKGQPVTREYGKMGKSLKNAVAPDDVCRDYGADTLRLYEMAMGPLEQSKPWNTRDIAGVHRFLQRLWRNIVDEETGELRVCEDEPDEQLRRLTHRTIAAVRQDVEQLRFNTAVARLIELNNALVGLEKTPRFCAETIVLLTAPFAPHIAEELWERLGHARSLAYEPLPKADPAMLVEEEVETPVQINGKVRSRVRAPAGADEETLKKLALADEKVQRLLEGKAVRKIVVAPGGRLVSIVAG